MLSPTKSERVLITSSRLELGSITIGFLIVHFLISLLFTLIRSIRLTLPRYLFSFDTMYPSVFLSFLSCVMA